MVARMAPIDSTPLLVELAAVLVVALALLTRRPLRRLLAALRHPVVTARHSHVATRPRRA
jgi:hypothetical protein